MKGLLWQTVYTMVTGAPLPTNCIPPPTITYQPHANHTQEGKQQAIALITDATQAFAEMGNEPPPSSTHEELPRFHPVRALQEDGQTRPKQGGWLQTLDTRP